MMTGMTSRMDDIQNDLRPGQLRSWKNGLGLFFVVEVEGVRCDLIHRGYFERRTAVFVSKNSDLISEHT